MTGNNPESPQQSDSTPFNYSPLLESAQRTFQAVETLQKTMWLQVNAKITDPRHQDAADEVHVVVERVHRAAWYLVGWAKGVYETEIVSINKSEIAEARNLIAEGFEKTFELQAIHYDLTQTGRILHRTYDLKREFRDVVNKLEDLSQYLTVVPSHE